MYEKEIGGSNHLLFDGVVHVCLAARQAISV